MAASNKKTSKIGVDRISDLPYEVLECILVLLPFKDVVRTSVLSTNWRYRWTLFARLKLDDFNSTDVLQYTNIVSNILLRHVGPIHTLFLHIPAIVPEHIDISHWIQSVSGKCVQKLGLCHDTALFAIRKLPSCMFSCVGFNSLTHLVLMEFGLSSLPTTFKGFPCLISLRLSNRLASTSEVNKIGYLVSKCPLLVTLGLNIYGRESCLSIYAPRLRDLDLRGHLSSICFEETKQIKALSFQASCKNRSDIIELFTCLMNVEYVSLGSRFWPEDVFSEVGCAMNFQFPIELRRLRRLKLCTVPLHCKGAIAVILGLFQIASNLQKLEIDVKDTGQLLLDNMKVEDCCLYNLKCAKLRLDLRSVKITLQLIKLILSSSPILEVMTIESHQLREPAKENLNIPKELLRYRRASANAEIICKI